MRSRWFNVRPLTKLTAPVLSVALLATLALPAAAHANDTPEAFGEDAHVPPAVLELDAVPAAPESPSNQGASTPSLTVPQAKLAFSDYSVTLGPRALDDIHTITVRLFGDDGAARPGAAASLSAVLSPSGATTGTWVEAQPGVYTAYIKATRPGSYLVSMFVDGVRLPITANPEAQFVAEPSAADSRYSVTTGAQPVTSGEHFLTVALTDRQGNPAPADPWALNATAIPDSGVGFGSFVPTGMPGEYRAKVTSTTAGDKRIVVTLFGAQLQVGGNDTATFVVLPVDIESSSFTVSEGSQSIFSGVHTLTVTLRDATQSYVNVSPSLLQAIATPSNGVNLGTFTQVSPGTYRAAITSTTPGSKLMALTLGGEQVMFSGNRIALFHDAPIDFAKSDFTVSTGSQPVVTGTHTLRITLRTAYDTPVLEMPAISVLVDLPAGVTVGTLHSTSTPGVYEADVTSSVLGPKWISVLVGGKALSASGNDIANFHEVLAAANWSYWVSNGEQLVTTGSHTITAVVTSDDLASAALDLSQLDATATPFAGVTIGSFVATATPGVYEAIVTSTVPGAKTISLTFDGEPIMRDGNIIARFAEEEGTTVPPETVEPPVVEPPVVVVPTVDGGTPPEGLALTGSELTVAGIAPAIAIVLLGVGALVSAAHTRRREDDLTR